MTLALTAEEIIQRQKSYQTAWRMANPDKVKEYSLKHSRRPSIKAKKLQWQKDHKDDLNVRRRIKYKEEKELLRKIREKPHDEL